MTELIKKHCVPCEGGVPPLNPAKVAELMQQLRPDWKLVREDKMIEARFNFKNYWQTTAFVNAVAWIAHREDHHPDIAFGYKTCTVSYWTHAAGGLTENDFICAAKVDVLQS